MNKAKLAYSIVVILLGIAMFVYGGYDDSPGAQGLGLVAVIFGIRGILRNRKKKPLSL